MFTFILPILKWLLPNLLSTALEGWKEKIKQAGAQDKLAAEIVVKEIEADIEARKAAKEVLIAEQGRWYTAIIRPLGALPFIIFTWKVIVWDKVLGLGKTDPLDPNMWAVFMVIVGAFYGGRSLEKVASKVTEVFKKR